jgi:hypothetical protein
MILVMSYKDRAYMSPHAKMPGYVSQRNPVSVFNLYLRIPLLYQRPGQTYRKYIPEDLHTFTLATTRHQSNTKYAWALVNVRYKMFSSLLRTQTYEIFLALYGRVGIRLR